MRANCVLTIVSGLLLAQCATKSADLKPVSVPMVQYQSYTCPQLEREAEALSAKEAELAAVQDQKLTGLKMPFGGGDSQETANRLAVVKGELEIIRRTRVQKNCA